MASAAASARALLRAALQEAYGRDWRAPAAPWGDFVARFSLPPRRKGVSAYIDRVALNSHVYQANYVALLLFALLLFMLRQPRAVLAVAPSAALWVRATSPRPVVVRGRRVTRRQRFGVAAAVSLVLGVLSGLFWGFISVGWATVCVCLLHACLRHSHARAGSQLGVLRDGKENGNW